MGAESAAKQGPRTVDLISLCFPLDESTLREAEQAASRFVNGPWGDSIREPVGGAFNGGGAHMDPGMGMPGMDTTMGMGMPGMGHWVAYPAAATGTALASPGANMAGAMGGTMMQFGTLVPAGIVAGAPMAPAPQAGPKPQQPAVPAPTTAPSAAAPAPAAPAAPAHERWSSMVDDGPLPSPPPARAPQAEPRSAGEAAEGPAHPAPTSRPQAPEGGGKAAALAAPAPSRPPEAAPAQPPSQAPAVAPRLPPNAPRPASPAEGPRAVESPQAVSSAPAANACSSPTGRSFGQPKSWKDIVNKEQADAVAAASARLASSTPKEASKSSDETRKPTIIDYFLLVSRHKAEGEGHPCGHV
ncbi:unnamed protein product [Prorocentrum cordatum]|uniref:Uncharacterized protein n=1 Tax=Prorocentrum cordatum TaxID=2364126 RepID=A0ABN9PSC5_9DINO|nr:unnamed protein product [Polarella glacialis]